MTYDNWKSDDGATDRAVGMKVMFLSNGNTAVFNSNGEQVPFLQESWFLLFLDFLTENAIKPTDCTFEMPDGTFARPFWAKDPDGGAGRWNWEIV